MITVLWRAVSSWELLLPSLKGSRSVLRADIAFGSLQNDWQFSKPIISFSMLQSLQVWLLARGKEFTWIYYHSLKELPKFKKPSDLNKQETIIHILTNTDWKVPIKSTFSDGPSQHFAQEDFKFLRGSRREKESRKKKILSALRQEFKEKNTLLVLIFYSGFLWNSFKDPL